jgi:hypothetical protein
MKKIPYSNFVIILRRFEGYSQVAGPKNFFFDRFAHMSNTHDSIFFLTTHVPATFLFTVLLFDIIKGSVFSNKNVLSEYILSVSVFETSHFPMTSFLVTPQLQVNKMATHKMATIYVLGQGIKKIGI